MQEWPNKDSMKYHDRIAVCEIMCNGPGNSEKKTFFEEIHDGRNLAFKKCKEFFKEFPGPEDWEFPSDKEILTWIDDAWLTQDQISVIRNFEKGSK